MTEGIKTIIDTKKVWIPLASVICLCGGLYWIGYSVASIDSKITNLGDRITALEAVVKDSKDANRELMGNIMDHEKRITTLESTCLKK